MKTTIPTAENYIKQYLTDYWEGGKAQYTSEDVQKAMIEFAKLHVQACKEEIADDYLYYLDGDEGSERLDNKKFFKESYPIENIK